MNMGVTKYTVRGNTCWRVDEWLTMPDGSVRRVRKSRVPTKEQAVMLAAKLKAEAFEGRHFDRLKTPKVTVRQLWEHWSPISRRDKDSWRSDIARAEHLLRHLGNRVASNLTQADIDEYRSHRLAETTRRGGPPSPATLDLELAQLKRMCSYAVECGRLQVNPVARVKLLRKPNVRQVTLDEPTFLKLVEAAEPSYRPVLLMAYDTGMREGEILNLRWSQLDLKDRAVRLGAEDTKTNKARTVYLTDRVIEPLQQLPRQLHSEYVFVSHRTGSRWSELRRAFDRARKAVGREDLWFHDLRRSFVTNARRRGVPESVVMRMSGHRTRNVFDRYNVVEDEDVRNAVKTIEAGTAREVEQTAPVPGHLLDTVTSGAPE
jgi:integrase